METIETIKAKHPVRKEFADRSTGSFHGDYYPTKGHALTAFDGVLQGYELCLDRNELNIGSGDTGRNTIRILNEFGREVGCAVFSWYRMPSGRYEFIGYIS